MVLKTTWDYCFYWSILALLFFNQAVTRLADDAALRGRLLEAVSLNQSMQERFRAAADRARYHRASGRFFDQQQVPLMERLNRELGDRLDSLALAARIDRNVERLERLAGYIDRRLDNPQLPADEGERELLGTFPELLRG